MNREQIIDIFVRLGDYFRQDDTEWQEVKARAVGENPWFTPVHVDMAVNQIADRFLRRELLQPWAESYAIADGVKKVGIVMAANIPLVGFHDLLCGMMSGHELWIRTSARDEVLLKHVVHKLTEWAPELTTKVRIEERLNGCDAYIATGSNNSARYFEEYFGKYPHVIRRNRTSVAVLDGSESRAELEALAEDVYLYFGLGCRNVTQLCVPRDYDFVALLDTFRIKNDYANFHKYKNNYDYHLAIYLLNRVPYMSNESLLMVENEIPFSAVSVLHYRYYDDLRVLRRQLAENADIQAVTGHDYLPFGTLQQPGLADYADGVDTLKFLTELPIH